jgi:hypothetical protein
VFFILNMMGIIFFFPKQVHERLLQMLQMRYGTSLEGQVQF